MNLVEFPKWHPVWKLVDETIHDIYRYAIGAKNADFVRDYLGEWAVNGKPRNRLTPVPV